MWDQVSVAAGAVAVAATVQANYTALHAAPTYTNVLSDALLKAVSKPPDSSTKYGVGSLHGQSNDEE